VTSKRHPGKFLATTCRTGPPPAPSRQVPALPLLAALLGALTAPAPAKLKAYQSRYYIIYTDLDADSAREAAVRMTAMAEEYHRRTRGFSRTIRSKLPFLLFRRAEDYYKAGGPVGSAGVFLGSRLMVVAGDRPTSRTWRVVQHEGFHQFAHAVIRARLPVWLDEGLAEYFAEAIFTGDSFITGVVRPARLRRLQGYIRTGRLKSIREMMRMTRKEWNAHLAGQNYDQGWSMVHFLVHADDGRYVKRLSRYINDIARPLPAEHAWVKNFGRDIDAFERRWRKYWLSQPPNPTADLYTKAVVATLSSFLARAYSQGQTFPSAEAFFQAARAGQLKAHQEDYLPPSLLQRNIAKAAQLRTWSMETPARRTPRLVLTLADGKRFVGSFTVRAGRVQKVKVTIRPPEKSPLRKGAHRPTAPGK